MDNQTQDFEKIANQKKDLNQNNDIKDVSIYKKSLISENIEMSDEKKADLCFMLASDISSCIEDKEDIISEVDKIRAAIHIEADPSDKVSEMENASNYRDTLTSAHIKIIGSTIKRTLIANPVWLINLPFQKEYERWLNDSFSYCTWNYANVEQKLRDAVDLAIKEFVSFIEVFDYVEESYENITETYGENQLIEFRMQYPDYEALGLKNNKEYKDLLKDMAEDIDNVGEAKISLYKKKIQNKIGLEVRNIDEIFILPWNSTNIDDAKGVFSKVMKTNADLAEASRIGYYNTDAVDRVINSPISSTSDRSEYKESMDSRFYTDDFLEDYARPIYQGVYKYVLDDKVGEEEFYIHFDYYTQQILRIERYQRIERMRNIIPFVVMPEHNRIYGSCIAKELIHTQELVDTLFNQIIDNNHVANNPIYKASLSERDNPNSSLYKRRFDDRLEFQPGLTVFVEKSSDFEQMKSSALDTNALASLISLLQRNASTMDGASELQSGQADPQDPSAPAKKTEIQLSQSTMRIDDYLRDLRPSVNKLGMILLNKYINIQPAEWKKYQVKFANENIKSLNQVAMRPQDLVVEDIILDVRGQSMLKNKDGMTREIQFVLGSLMQVPQLQQSPQTIYMLLDKFLANLDYSRNEIDGLLSPLKQMAEMQIQQSQSAPNTQGGANPPQPPSLPPEILEEALRRGQKVEQPANRGGK